MIYNLLICFFLYLIIFILICQYKSLRKKKEIKKCKWKSKYISYDYSRKDLCNKYIKFINDLDIFYFIGFGSQLGAVRNGGLIKKDVDIDVILPITKNQHIFKCNENINITNKNYDNKLILLKDDILLCKTNRSYYSKIFYKYLKSKSEGNAYYKVELKKLSVVALHMSNNLYIDFYLTIANEWLWRDYNLCKCKFCDTYTYCNINSFYLSKVLYGDSFLIAKSNKSSLKIYTASVNDI